ncbi:MAG: hypothetical protein HY722_06785, partial [Planctomycetes bacterium]|nr:hypothetical protein [Planctomycetota bacterium]
PRSAGDPGPAGRAATSPEAEPPERDFWYRRFHPYMDAAFQRDYLATPRPERYARYHRELVSFQERERLLEEARPPLAEAERAAFYRLDSAEACRAWLQARGRRLEEERLP